MIVLSTLAGYIARRMNWIPERVAVWLMTGVVVFGYTPVSFLSIWTVRPGLAEAWLPVLGGAQVAIMAFVGLMVGRLLTADRQEVGLMGMVTAVGNTGFTMGGFVIFLLYGEEGLGRGSIYALMWYLMMVLVLYPIARHYSGQGDEPLGRLMLRSLFNWRSIGLPITVVGLTLTLCQVPRPQAVTDYHVVPILMYIVLPAAYFSIGLRLHLGSTWRLRKFIAALAGLRFLGGAALALLMAAATQLTAYPLTGASRGVLLINSCVPTAITAVAVANMFHLRPCEASVLFVINSTMYLTLVLPIVVWLMK